MSSDKPPGDDLMQATDTSEKKKRTKGKKVKHTGDSVPADVSASATVDVDSLDKNEDAISEQMTVPKEVQKSKRKQAEPEEDDEGAARRKKEKSEKAVKASSTSTKDEDGAKGGKKRKKKRESQVDISDEKDSDFRMKEAESHDSEILTELEKDPSLSEQTVKGLLYAKSYVASREDSGLSWKFNKAKQNWLMRHVFEREHIPDTYFDLALAYLKSIQGGSRDALRKSCDIILNPSPIQPSPIAPSTEADNSNITAPNDTPAKPKSALKKSAETQQKKEPTQEELENLRIKEDRARKLLDVLQ
ncbi:hypothetical protein FRC03_008319 [Tulasnella sp. 419]|nr:hypothetical protein FRC03_008319 [Tulasnella sp. 419]